METEELATVVSAALTIYWQPPSKGLMPGLLYSVPLTPRQPLLTHLETPGLSQHVWLSFL